MVKQEEFTVELVDAENKKSFKEHVSLDGKTFYIEVEPDVEYFVRVGSDRKPVIVEVIVDGEDLGTTFCINNCGFGLMDLTSRRNGKLQITALKIENARFSPKDTTDIKPVFWTGNVTAIYYERFDTGEYTVKKDHECPWQPHDIVAYVEGLSNLKHKKGVRTGKGDTIIEKEEHKKKRLPKKGRKLCSITVNYCTAVGAYLC